MKPRAEPPASVLRMARKIAAIYPHAAVITVQEMSSGRQWKFDRAAVCGRRKRVA